LFALQTGKDVLAEYGLLVRNLRKNTYIELLNAVSQLEQEIANVLIAPAVQGSNLSQLAVAQEEEFATERFRMNYQDELSEARLTSALLQVLPRDREIVIVCIGTDRNTGDALGPFVGTKLMESLSGEEVTIYGSIDDPVHAINLEKTLDQISMKHGMPFILAIDAALGKLSSVGSIDMFKGSLKPGAGVGKKLPEVGSYSIMGIVNVGGFMEYYVLSNTRLSLIMRMADVIANSIARAVTIIQEQTAESNEEPPVREAI
jgi:putative sporulation protein YyaC